MISVQTKIIFLYQSFDLLQIYLQTKRKAHTEKHIFETQAQTEDRKRPGNSDSHAYYGLVMMSFSNKIINQKTISVVLKIFILVLTKVVFLYQSFKLTGGFSSLRLGGSEFQY